MGKLKVHVNYLASMTYTYYVSRNTRGVRFKLVCSGVTILGPLNSGLQGDYRGTVHVGNGAITASCREVISTLILLGGHGYSCVIQVCRGGYGWEYKHVNHNLNTCKLTSTCRNLLPHQQLPYTCTCSILSM